MKLSDYAIDDRFIVIAPEIPNWLVLNKIEYYLLRNLRIGRTIKESMEATRDSQKMKTSDILEAATSVLSQITKKKFYHDTERGAMCYPPNPKVVQLYLTRRCNLRCTHCYVDAGNEKAGELGELEWKQIVDCITKKIGATNFTLSGGEPLLFRGVFNLMEYIKSKGHTVMLLTNGTLIQDKQTAQKLARLLDNLQISIDGATATSNDEIRGMGTFNKIVEAIRLMIEEGIKIDLSMQVLPSNIDDLEEYLVGFVKSFNYKKLELRLNYKLIRSGRATELPINSQAFNDICKLRVARILDKLAEAGCCVDSANHNRKNSNVSCGVGAGFFVDSDGDVYPCSDFYYKIGNILMDGINLIIKDLDEMYYQLSVDNMALCKDCDLKLICKGGCRLENYKQSHDFLIPICDNEHKLSLLRDLVYIHA